MMYKIVPGLLLGLLVAFGSSGQRVSPFAGVEYSPFTGYVRMHDCSLYLGATLDKRFFLSVGSGYQRKVYQNEDIPSLRYWTTSITGTFRVLKSDRLVSPIFQLTNCFGHTYQGDSAYVDFNGISALPHAAAGRFVRLRRMTSLQAGASIQWKHLSFQLAGGFYYACAEIVPMNTNKSPSISDYNWTASARASYVFQWKKE